MKYVLQYPEDGGSGSGDYEDDSDYSDQDSDPDPNFHNKDKVQMTALYYCPAELEILKCCPKVRRQRDQVQSNEMTYYFMTSHQIG